MTLREPDRKDSWGLPGTPAVIYDDGSAPARESRQPALAWSAQRGGRLQPIQSGRPAPLDFQEEVRLELQDIQRKLDSLLNMTRKERVLARRESLMSLARRESLLSSFSKNSETSSALPSKLTSVRSLHDLDTEEKPPQKVSSLRELLQNSPPSSRLNSSPNLRKSALSELSAKEVAKAAVLHRFRRRGLKLFEKVWDLLENPESSPAAYRCAWGMPGFIILTVLFALVQTINPPLLDARIAGVVETAIESIFLLEFVVRFLACPNRQVFFMSVYNLIDFAAAVPLAPRAAMSFVLPHGDAVGLPEGIMVTVVPIVRLLKLLRRFETFHLLLKAFSQAAEALPVLLFILSGIGLIFSVLIFLVEDRDDVSSLSAAAWFTLVTMTTVGYGDIIPKSPAGSVIAGVLIIVTMLYMAIPIGIVGNAFTQTWNDRDRLLVMHKTREKLRQWGYTAADIPELFHLSDTNDDGEIDLAEFRELIKCMCIGLSDERIFQLFSTFDKDRSGRIDDREFVRALFPHLYHTICTPPPNRMSVGSSGGRSQRPTAGV